MENGEQGSAASVKAVEIGVAAVIFLFGALVVFDSYRLGARWEATAAAGLFSLLCRPVDLRIRRGDPCTRFAKPGACRRIVVSRDS